MSSPLPPNMAMTTVRGRYGTWQSIVGQPEPQFVPFVGMKIQFTPAYPFVTNTSATPVPLVIATAPRVFQTDSQGYMSDPNAGFNGDGTGINRNCQIVSSDDPDIVPSDWKYLVTFSGTGATHYRAFRTVAQAEATVDMAVLTPQRIPANSTPTSAEVAAAAAAQSAADAAASVASIRRGQAGGVAPLDADGDVNDAAGVKVLPGGSGGGGGGGSSTLAGITDMSALARLLNTDTTATAMRTRIGAGTGSSNVTIGTASGTAADAAATATALNTKATDANVLHKTGDETKSGVLTLTSAPVIPPATSGDNPATLQQLNSKTLTWDQVTGKPAIATLPVDASNITGLENQVSYPTTTGLKLVYEYTPSTSTDARPLVPAGGVIYWDFPGTVAPANMALGDKWLA